MKTSLTKKQINLLGTILNSGDELQELAHRELARWDFTQSGSLTELEQDFFHLVEYWGRCTDNEVQEKRHRLCHITALAMLLLAFDEAARGEKTIEEEMKKILP